MKTKHKSEDKNYLLLSALFEESTQDEVLMMGRKEDIIAQIESDVECQNDENGQGQIELNEYYLYEVGRRVNLCIATPVTLRVKFK